MKCQVSSYSLVWLNSLCNVMRVNITRCSLCSTYAVTLPPGIHRCCGHYFRQWNSLSTEFPQSLYSLQFERFFLCLAGADNITKAYSISCAFYWFESVCVCVWCFCVCFVSFYSIFVSVLSGSLLVHDIKKVVFLNYYYD